jgi:hypothetical protein
MAKKPSHAIIPLKEQATCSISRKQTNFRRHLFEFRRMFHGHCL